MAPPTKLSFDRQFAAAAAAIAAETGAAQVELPAGDVEGRRKVLGSIIMQTISALPDVPDVVTKQHTCTAEDGHKIVVTEFRPRTSPPAPSPAVYHMHGGGMILGSVVDFEKAIKTRAAAAGMPLFSVEYRLAPEHPHPTPVNDCYAGLVWLHSHAKDLGIDNSRIMVQGESAGGGLAAGVALMARDKKLDPPLAFQKLIYPMLDDRNLKLIEAIEGLAMWKATDNTTGWQALLGKEHAGSDKLVEGHEYAAPARAKSLAGLPPTYIDVGQLDIFAKEDMVYAMRLLEADVAVEFHLYPGLPHGFEGVGAGTAIAKVAMANRQRVDDEFRGWA